MAAFERCSVPRTTIFRLGSLVVLFHLLAPEGVRAQPMPACATLANIACGATTSGTIATQIANVGNCHAFGAQAGEVVSISVARQGVSALGTAWRLFDGTGTAVHTACNADVPMCGAAVTLTGTPPYTIVVNDFDFNATGSYDVTLEPLSATFNGAASCASPIACGVAIANVVSQASDVDTFRFAAAAGEVVAIGVAVQEVAYLKPAWRLYGPAGNLLESACDSNAGSCRRTVALASTGQHTIKISDFGLGDTGAYSVSLQAVSATLAGAANCAETLGCGASSTDVLTHNASIDAYRFAAAPGEAVSIGASRQSIGFLNPAWTLFDASGTPVEDACDTDTITCRSDVTLTGPSPYTLMVSDYDVSTSGTYSVTVEPLSATFAGVPSCATPLDCGIPALADIGDRSDSDVFRIDADPGEAVSIATARESGGRLNPAWTLYDAAGAVVESSCDVDTASCQADVTLSGPAPYTLAVSDFELFEIGDYSVTVHSISSTYGGSAPCGTPIACGEPEQAVLSARADIDGYRFSVAAGDIVAITAARQGGGDLVPEWVLFNSSGTALGACSTGATSCTAEAVLAGTPPYTLSVSMRGHSSTGAYTVEVDGGNCCAGNADCAGNVCTVATCNASGFCPVQNSVPCNDGLSCTSADACSVGECHGVDNCSGGDVCNPMADVCVDCLDDLACDDGDVCTSEVCGGGNTCVYTPTALACDDGLFCNGLDACAAGTCSVHVGDPCDTGTGCIACNEGPETCTILEGAGCASDGNACTSDVCDENGFCAHEPQSAACSDGLACTTGDTCVGGICVGVIPRACVDGDPCTADLCDDIDGCVNTAAPLGGCRVAGRSTFVVRDRAVDTRDQLTWRWTRGEETSPASLGDPTLATSYALCVFDTSTGSPTHVITLAAPAGSPAWKVSRIGDGFTYTDRQRLVDGLDTVRMQAGAPGRSRVEVKARGVFLELPPPFDPGRIFDGDPGVFVQLVNNHGTCWASAYETAVRNVVDEFRAREP